MKHKGYVVVYENEDGTLSPSDTIYSTPECAVDSIPVFEGRRCHGVSAVDVNLIEDAPSAMRYRLAHSN